MQIQYNKKSAVVGSSTTRVLIFYLSKVLILNIDYYEEDLELVLCRSNFNLFTH